MWPKTFSDPPASASSAQRTSPPPLKLFSIFNPCDLITTAYFTTHLWKSNLSHSWVLRQFAPQDLCGRKDLIPVSCPLTSTCTAAFMCPPHTQDNCNKVKPFFRSPEKNKFWPFHLLPMLGSHFSGFCLPEIQVTQSLPLIPVFLPSQPKNWIFLGGGVSTQGFSV